MENEKRKTENGRRRTENFPFSTFSFLFFACLAMMAASLTLSPFMMGASHFLLIAAWLFMGEPIGVKFKRFLHNKIALVLVSLYLLHVVGLLYTSDFAYAMKDLRVKLPLLVLPLVLSSVKPLEKRWRDLLMLVYVAAVFIATCISFWTYIQHDYQDIREISRFISHIRFCLNIVLVIGIIGYYLFTRKMPWWEKLLTVGLILWFVYQLYIFESISGYIAFVGLIAATLLYLFFTKVKNKPLRIAGAFLVIALPIAIGIYLVRTVESMLTVKPVNLEQLDKTTALGNDYWHDTVCFPVENGEYVGLYFCRQEMCSAWNSRSTLDYEGKTLNGENLEATLARYLTSKGLRKDAQGVAALNDQDIQNVEQGIANYVNWTRPGVYARLSETLFEYSQYRRQNNPNGGSLSQRLEYTKASWHLIQKHPVFGVGTGDIPNAYTQAYNELDSPLAQEFRHRAHNQYLSITVGFGVVGLALFLFVLFYPYLSSKKTRSYLYTIFMVILLISMLPEDTIESQAGVTWFALFNSFFIFAFRKEEDSSEQQ